MDIEAIGGLVQEHLLQGLFAVVILPLLNWLVGRSKRDHVLREEQQLRHHMELSRGLHELAKLESEPEARAELETMRTRIHTEFLDKARLQLSHDRAVRRDAPRRYWIVPQPHGFFGWVWTILTVINLALFAVILVALAFALPELFDPNVSDSAEMAGQIIGLIIVVLIFAAPTLLFRWFSFISARMGSRAKARRAERQAAAAQQSQAATA